MNWNRSLLAGAAAIVALAVATGCSSGNGANEQAGPPSSATATASATEAPAGQDHNQADVMFAHHMNPHHQQAIEMSDVVLAKQGIDPGSPIWPNR